MKKMKKNNGITLVALVVTIIILLILAGITIGQLGNSGLLNKSETSAQEYNKKAIEEEFSILMNQYKMEEIINENINFMQFMLDHGADNVDREDNVYTIQYKGLVFTETVGKAEFITGIESINLTFEDLISSSELKINVETVIEQGQQITISKYKYIIYKDENIFKQETTTTSSCVIDGLTPNDNYKVSVIVYDNEGKSSNSEMVNYTKLPVYEWKKYVATVTSTYYAPKNMGEKRLDVYSNTNYATVSNVTNCFNTSTGIWTSDGTLNVPNKSSMNALSNAFSGNNILIDNKVYCIFGYSGGSATGSNWNNLSSKSILYQSEEKHDYEKSNEFIETVKSNNQNAYSNEEGGGVKDGYWYIKVD